MDNLKNNFFATIGVISWFIFYIISVISYLHGIYLSFNESFLSFVLVMLIFPWAIIKGFMGFF